MAVLVVGRWTKINRAEMGNGTPHTTGESGLRRNHNRQHWNCAAVSKKHLKVEVREATMKTYAPLVKYLPT